VQLADSWEFLDAGVSDAPYGILPPNCLTDGGFLIDGDKSDLVRITIKPTQSMRIDTTHMRIGDDGLVACSTTCRFTGYYASDYGARFGRNSPEEFIDDYFIDPLDADCTTDSHDCRMEGDSCFITSLFFTSDGLAEKLDDNVLITPVGFSFKRNPFKSKHRNFPVDFAYPLIYQNVDVIEVDDTTTIVELPEDIAYQIGGATYTRDSKTGENGVTITSTLQVTNPVFAPVSYTSLREFFEKVAQAGDDVVILSQKSKTE